MPITLVLEGVAIHLNIHMYIYDRYTYVHAQASRCLSVGGSLATTMVAAMRHIDSNLSSTLLYTLRRGFV